MKAGAIVINSLRLTMPGLSSVIRDAGIVGDPDLVELESEGIISITNPDEIKPVPQSIQPIQKPQQAIAKQGKKQQGKTQSSKQTPPQKPEKPGTSFNVDDSIGDEMGRTVVIMGANGPEVKKMNPGINGGDGPKYVGDQTGIFEQDIPSDQDDGFTDV